MQIETFLDVFLIEEIPVENATSTGIVTAGGQEIVRSQKAARKPMTGKVVSCGEKFPYNGLWVENPYKAGDVVRTNEFGRNYIVLNDDDEFKPSAAKFYLIRYEDIEGRVRVAKPHAGQTLGAGMVPDDETGTCEACSAQKGAELGDMTEGMEHTCDGYFHDGVGTWTGEGHPRA